MTPNRIAVFVVACISLWTSFNAYGKTFGKSAVTLSTRNKTPGNHVIILPSKKESISRKIWNGLTYLGGEVVRASSTVVSSAARMNRDATAYFSSDFEVLLLDMTSPTDEMIDPVDMDRFLATTKSFVRNDDVVSQSNTYRTTLRKLWAKISEQDNRTILKAVHIFHKLCRLSHPLDGVIYQKLVLRMNREYSKRSRSKHFCKLLPLKKKSLSTPFIPAAAAPTHQLELDERFVANYYAYVVMRAKLCVSRFEEIRNISLRSDPTRALLTVSNPIVRITTQLAVNCFSKPARI